MTRYSIRSPISGIHETFLGAFQAFQTLKTAYFPHFGCFGEAKYAKYTQKWCPIIVLKQICQSLIPKYFYPILRPAEDSWLFSFHDSKMSYYVQERSNKTIPYNTSLSWKMGIIIFEKNWAQIGEGSNPISLFLSRMASYTCYICNFGGRLIT